MQRAKDLISTCHYCLGGGEHEKEFSIAGVDGLSYQDVRLVICYAAAHLKKSRQELCEPVSKIKEVLRRFDMF